MLRISLTRKAERLGELSGYVSMGYPPFFVGAGPTVVVSTTDLLLPLYVVFRLSNNHNINVLLPTCTTTPVLQILYKRGVLYIAADGHANGAAADACEMLIALRLATVVWMLVLIASARYDIARLNRALMRGC